MESVYARHQTATFLLVGTKLDKIYRTSVAERRREFVWNNVRQRCGQKVGNSNKLLLIYTERLVCNRCLILHFTGHRPVWCPVKLARGKHCLLP
jgi:hypothetical protein